MATLATLFLSGGQTGFYTRARPAVTSAIGGPGEILACNGFDGRDPESLGLGAAGASMAGIRNLQAWASVHLVARDPGELARPWSCPIPEFP
jgi:hypothetical protein